MAQKPVAICRSLVKDIAALIVDQARMDMQARPRLLGKGLGHERRLKPMLCRHALDDAPQHHGMVASQHRVIQMAKVHLKLRPAIFRRGRTCRHALGDAGRINLGQKARPFVQLVKGQNARGLGRAARPCGQGRADATLVVALGVHKVELQLIGHHRAQPQFGKTRHDRTQNGARIKPPMRGILGRGRGNLDLSRWHLGPRHGHQSAGQGVAGGIRITIRKADAIDIPARPQRIQRGDACAKGHAR